MNNRFSRIKKKFKIIIRLAGLLVVFFFIGLSYFFIVNDAPILEGEVEYGVQYNSEQTLDVYRPTQNVFDQSPVILFIHGGAWIVGRKESVNMNRFNHAINSLRELGYTVVTPSYRLATENHPPFPQSIVDIYDALEWIKSNADLYQFDIDNIGVFGESAGAHLAMMVAYSQPSEFGLSYEPIPLNYVIDIYGPSELDDLYHFQTTDSVKSLLSKIPQGLQGKLDISALILGVDPKNKPEEASEIMSLYSPITYLNRQDPATLIIHGDADIVVPIDQSYLLKAALDSLEISNEFHVLSGVNHAFFGESDEQKDSIQQWVVSFIEGNYNEKNAIPH